MQSYHFNELAIIAYYELANIACGARSCLIAFESKHVMHGLSLKLSSSLSQALTAKKLLIISLFLYLYY